MAEKQEIDALLRKVQEAGAKNLLVVYTTREGNQTSLEHVGLTGNDLVMVSAYTRHRLDRAVTAFFNQRAEGASPAPVMHAPKTDAVDLSKLKSPPGSPAHPVSRAVRRALKRVVTKAEKKQGKK